MRALIYRGITRALGVRIHDKGNEVHVHIPAYLRKACPALPARLGDEIPKRVVIR
jgi:hypothetical protein